MESSDRRPAGGGMSAAAFLNESSGTTDIVPKPPSSQPSGRPQPRRDNSLTDSGEEEIWRGLFQDVVASGEALRRCTTLGAQLQRGALELISVGRAEGVNEADLKRIVCDNIFRPCPNPQDGARVESEVSADDDKKKKGHVQVMDGPAREESESFDATRNEYRKMASFSADDSVDSDRRRHSEKIRAGLQQKDLRTATVVKDLFASKHVEGHPSLIYDLGTQLGQGTFGTVRKARHRQTHQIHAIKAVKKEVIDEGGLWAEIDIMKQLDHPHIMRLYYTFEDEESIYMASEMCLGGELYDTIDEAGFFTERIAAFLFVQIVGSVNYLHLKSICHRDLKPENFLVLKRVEQDQLQLKLIDFGTSKRFDLKPMVTKVCTAHYVAPEVLKRGDVAYTEKVDIWSCGVILYMMLCGFMPFHHDSQAELLKLVKKGKYEYKPDKVWKLISQEAKDLIAGMMCPKVDKRLAASEVLEHRWIQNSDDLRHQQHMDEQIVRQMKKFLTNNRLKRVALQIIARQITDESIQRLRDIFQDIDVDSSGCLTLDEMKEALKKLDINEASQQEMAHILACVDQDQSGTIEWTEFLAATLTKEQYLKEETLKGAFYVLDVDEDGVLSSTDLVSLMGLKADRVEGLLSYSSLLEIEGIMKECDENGDGDISYEEFCVLMDEDGPRASDTAVSLRYRRGKRERYSVLTDDQLARAKTEALGNVLNTQYSMNAELDEDTIDGDHDNDVLDDFGEEDEHFAVKVSNNHDHTEWRMQSQKAWELNGKRCTLTIYEKKDEGLLEFEIVYVDSGERMTATGSKAEFDALCEEQTSVTGPAKTDAAIRQLFGA
jgi:calcium-dependent protein kinase|mmetsp:Transcript_49328/g.78036  ORF Transcript_49328/g.78036 Transcript_49328/m.78036 type:complete len:831 (-) Transcript_49328:30-2522(-)|eukprot:CAMPEP_0169325754 /NCGR_PEP_ID=MMETSP1017-20121227/11155_1 /TAXON_ID=342587 /ORGANISM="Karlodinium micrum, Strain CCMP2283" /LENGTH=830 /DNA_ID=CAMNT_0009420451 /DNA_START=23 /DNA_END=2515 /DNA_ORIENTATION=-